MKNITLIRIMHSAIWLVMAAAVIYILYSGIANHIDGWTYTSIGLIVFEIIVLVLNHWSCPFTLMAKESKRDWKDGDDIFLPTWFAVRNKMIFGTLFIIGTMMVLYRILFK